MSAASARRRTLACLCAAVLAGCASHRESSESLDSGECGFVLGLKVQTSARQRVVLDVDGGEPGQAPLQATADLPAYSTSRDFAGLLAFVLGQKGCPAASEECPGCDPEECEALVLPPGWRVSSLVVEKRVGESWAPAGPEDLRVVCDSLACRLPGR